MEPIMPGPEEHGRLFVAPSVTPPTLTICRWCKHDLHVLGPVVFCPDCDCSDEMTTNQEGTTA